MARAIQNAGAAVVIVEGPAGLGPYALGFDPWHKLPEGFAFEKGEKVLPCPILFEGWVCKADEIRAMP